MSRVFVYGSLLRGMENHLVMEGCEFLCVTRTRAEFQMLDLGLYPAVISGTCSVVGEVYSVDSSALARLDAFERVPELYVRKKTMLDDGMPAWIYIYNTSKQDVDSLMRCPKVPLGDWADWKQGR